MLTAGELRKLIEGKPDDWEVPIDISYGDDVVDGVFCRLDFASINPDKGPGSLHGDEPGIFLTISLVDGEDNEDEDEEDEDDDFDDDEDFEEDEDD